MQNAKFSIVDYQFEKVNIDLTAHNSTDLQVNFQLKGSYFPANAIFELTFLVRVSDEKGDTQFEPFVSVQCKGKFKFEEKTAFDEIPNFFYANSIAILFPYVRAYISLVTTQANVKGIILPTYNLSSLGNDLKENTIQQ